MSGISCCLQTNKHTRAYFVCDWNELDIAAVTMQSSWNALSWWSKAHSLTSMWWCATLNTIGSSLCKAPPHNQTRVLTGRTLFYPCLLSGGRTSKLQHQRAKRILCAYGNHISSVCYCLLLSSWVLMSFLFLPGPFYFIHILTGRIWDITERLPLFWCGRSQTRRMTWHQ